MITTVTDDKFGRGVLIVSEEGEQPTLGQLVRIASKYFCDPMKVQFNGSDLNANGNMRSSVTDFEMSGPKPRLLRKQKKKK